MARHIEHPGSRHSKPASRNTRSSPSASACALTSPDPGTTIASLMPSATCLPRATAAAARRSSIRPFVHDPIKTLSSAISSIGIPGLRSIYSRALCQPNFRNGSASLAGSGTQPSTATTISGDVPQVTCGKILVASSSISLSNTASSSDTNSPQAASASAHKSPLGA